MVNQGVTQHAVLASMRVNVVYIRGTKSQRRGKRVVGWYGTATYR